MPLTNNKRLRLIAATLLHAAILPASADEEKLPPAQEKVAPTAFSNEPPRPVLNWGEGRGRSYWVPAFDIFAFDFLLNQFNRHVLPSLSDKYGDESVYDTDWSSFRQNLTGKWVYDDDSFDVNQFLHPYQGNMYHGFARSAGLDYWPALGYTLAGSFLWETAGETSKPSINDQITTGFGGSFLGELLFRMASLTLESGDGRPGWLRELGAAAVSPSTGFNRWAYGERFDGVFRSHNPAVYTRAQLGVNLNASLSSNVNLNPVLEGDSVPQEFKRGEATADFTIDYGLPGKPGYRYDRPFDYFHFQLSAVTSNYLENIFTYGLLKGRSYAVGDRYRGVWGLYGTYDYIAPQIFRVSTTAAALGTTGQWWLSQRTALQGSALAGVGYGSAGIIEGREQRDYHHGVTPQALLAARLIVADRIAFEVTGREYYVSDIASDEKGGAENIARVDSAVTLRIWGLHGITLKYVYSARDAHYTRLPDVEQSVGAVSIAYTYLGHKWFGAVDWRPGARHKQEMEIPLLPED